MGHHSINKTSNLPFISFLVHSNCCLTSGSRCWYNRFDNRPSRGFHISTPAFRFNFVISLTTSGSLFLLFLLGLLPSTEKQQWEHADEAADSDADRSAEINGESRDAHFFLPETERRFAKAEKQHERLDVMSATETSQVGEEVA